MLVNIKIAIDVGEILQLVAVEQTVEIIICYSASECIEFWTAVFKKLLGITSSELN